MLRATRRLEVTHVTRYKYDRPIERSIHRLHLRPIGDWRQHVLSYKLKIKPVVPVI